MVLTQSAMQLIWYYSIHTVQSPHRATNSSRANSAVRKQTALRTPPRKFSAFCCADSAMFSEASVYSPTTKARVAGSAPPSQHAAKKASHVSYRSNTPPKTRKGLTFPSHLTLRAPTTPGTTARTGKPWSLGMGSPFISNANRTSPRGSTALSAGIDEP